MSDILGIILFIHNIVRWLILISLVLYISYIIFDFVKLRLNKSDEEKIDLFNRSKLLKEKLSFYLTIIVNIELLLGMSLYFSNPYLLGLWTDIASVVKQKELRIILIEHPILMIIFVGLIHYQNNLIKKVNLIDQYKKVIIINIIYLIILILGIPWFRPLIRI